MGLWTRALKDSVPDEKVTYPGSFSCRELLLPKSRSYHHVPLMYLVIHQFKSNFYFMSKLKGFF